MPFKDIHYKKKYRVLNLIKQGTCLKIKYKEVFIETNLLFQRLCFLDVPIEKKKEHFQFELAPYPTSLFEGGLLRKTKKSALFELFEKEDSKPKKEDCFFCN